MESKESYLKKLIRTPLQKKLPVGFIRLDRNEPPFSAFDIIEGILTHDDLKTLNLYPDLYSLYERLAEHFHLSNQQLLLTHGSEQGIRYVFDSFLDCDDEVVYLYPSYAMYDVYTYYNRAITKKIEFGESRHISLDRVIEAVTNKTRLFVLANPNNPTGSVFTFEEIKHIAKHTLNNKTMFLLDEAYFYYYKIDSLALIEEFSNLIITRSFSKAWGIAGARIGLIFSDKNNISLLMRQKPMHEINQLSMLVCEKILPHEALIVDTNVRQVLKWKKNFRNASLSNMRYLETEGNYILLESTTYEDHKRLFLDEEIIPKMDFSTPCIKNCFRFSVGNDEVMERICVFLK